MTVDEKLQQVQLLSDGQITDADAKAGVGGVFSLTDPAKINHFQQVAVQQSRLHIPILFAYDTIHGYRTIFPVPLGAASSFDPKVAATDASIGSRESATVGIKQIYSPMVDVSHEPRWGRIVEGNGEDPFLGSVMAAARVKGAQGNDYAARNKTVTSVKHFVAYGEPEGGRDYNTTDMSESRLRNLYLPPFKAAVDAGSDTVMCSFNSLNGVPGCANKDTETGILKKEWGFDGFIESDYTAVAELRACPPKNPDVVPCGHGTAADGPEAGAELPDGGDRLGDGQHQHPRQREGPAEAGQDHDESARRRRAPDPAREVPRRTVRAPLRQPGQGGRPGLVRHRGRPGRGPQGCVPLDGAAQEHEQHPAAGCLEEDGRHRTVRRQPARHARVPGGARARTRTRSACSPGSRRSRPARRTRPAAR